MNLNTELFFEITIIFIQKNLKIQNKWKQCKNIERYLYIVSALNTFFSNYI